VGGNSPDDLICGWNAASYQGTSCFYALDLGALSGRQASILWPEASSGTDDCQVRIIMPAKTCAFQGFCERVAGFMHGM
jgi:hypothetical protein